MTRSARKRWLASGGLALAVGALVAASYQLTLFSTAQARSTDFLFKSRAGEQARSTVLVGIDQRSYSELLPQHGALVNWPRALFARALDNLRRAGARVIVFDLFFDASRPDDQELVAAITRAGNVLVPVEAQGPKGADPRPGVAQEFEVFVRPTLAIGAVAAAEGFVNVTTDQDTVVRSLPLLLYDGHEELPALALVAVSQFVRRRTVVDAPPSAGVVHGAGRAIPLLPSDSMLINYLGPPSSLDRAGSFRIIPFVDALQGTLDEALVRDKIVLIGLTIRGMDEFSTPTTADTGMWGVEVLGNSVETILGQRFLVPASRSATIGAIFLAALLAALMVATMRPAVATLGALGALGCYLVAAGALFDGGLVLNLVYPPAALLLAFVAALAYRVVFEQAEQRAIRSVMARYLSPSVSQWVLKDPDRLHLGGETREMTVLFCDLRGFTTLTHAMEAHALVALLNEFMTAMTQIIFKHDGVLDKYMGDALMAFWNAPMDQPDHARRACAAALDMIGTLRELHADWARRGVPQLELGIGINSGAMVVGNMGSRERLAYTVLGDTVNVASRLEGLSKEYGVRVVLGEATRAAAGDAFASRFLGVVTVKGRNEPLSVYELVGRAG
ncbi:MAG: adenylate/guanylate cyclase domain-containing protein [Nitrospirae bacterium]|nr:MAG: adenylate/guanylate cyclase domain-containing protein [Nitrospirota bacterium]